MKIIHYFSFILPSSSSYLLKGYPGLGSVLSTHSKDIWMRCWNECPTEVTSTNSLQPNRQSFRHQLLVWVIDSCVLLTSSFNLMNNEMHLTIFEKILSYIFCTTQSVFIWSLINISAFLGKVLFLSTSLQVQCTESFLWHSPLRKMCKNDGFWKIYFSEHRLGRFSSNVIWS